ncbi:hypothetical protein ABVK25_003505 [Lepraria finkii]|uniref:Uncharacterized protein n=1 Tax=Lepraria finkii TaxID=1340010 RepID=A0ABR4BHG4_9LECA
MCTGDGSVLISRELARYDLGMGQNSAARPPACSSSNHLRSSKRMLAAYRPVSFADPSELANGNLLVTRRQTKYLSR